MSIALERSSSSNNRIEGSGFIRGLSCKSNFESTTETGRSSMSGILPGDLRLPLNNPAIMAVEEPKDLDDSCSSSSIGRNSDSSGRSVESDGEDETEVQSSYKGPLDTMDALEEVLPIRRGISKFYCGKSKSFTSLSDASASSSVKDLAKPDNAYTRKRKNLLACSNIIWGDNKNRIDNSLRRSDVGVGGGLSSKRPTNSNRRRTFPISMGTSSSESNNTSENSNSSSSSPPRLRPPLHPPVKSSLNNASSSPPTPPPPRRNSAFSPWRSFSLTDLQGAAADASDSNRPGSSSTTSSRGDHEQKRGHY
ncbi:hypothetical protein BVC80_209g72 [Macleaya cordata]|uniref:Uncharacterized protein n=1 Tax=Macleaya cordata TaxID=56857 RepID=A0A200QD87_MACCD|nr:hypothetical protein BVC80_209g72 [Macleaya cordata]